jgi:GNAT superfamily N-acetyltransferase
MRIWLSRKHGMTSSQEMNLKARLFSESDRRALREIYFESRKRTFTWLDGSSFKIEDFDDHTKGETIWVADYDSKPAGFISVQVADNYIHNLFVHPDAAGKGIGSALLKECLKNIGRPAALKCLSLNTVAVEFYISKGWKTVSEGDGHDGKYLLMHFDQTG